MTPAASCVLALLADGKARTRAEVRTATRLPDVTVKVSLLALRRDNLLVSCPTPPANIKSAGVWRGGKGSLWKLNPNP